MLASVVSVSGRQIRSKLHKLDVVVTDGRARLTLTFFNRRWLDKKLPAGTAAASSPGPSRCSAGR